MSACARAIASPAGTPAAMSFPVMSCSVPLAYDQAASGTLQDITGKLIAAGVPAGEAMARAQALIYATVQKQSALLASLDVFWLLCVLALAAAPLVLLIKNIRRGGAAAAGH